MSKKEARKRTNRIQVRLDDNEHHIFIKHVKKSQLSQETYLRHLINGVIPQEAPPPDYYAMMQQLYRIGNSLNQIAQKAHTLNVIDVQRYDAAYRQFETAVKEITEAVVQPKPMDKMGTPQKRKILWGEEHPLSGEPFAACGKSDERSAV